MIGVASWQRSSDDIDGLANHGPSVAAGLWIGYGESATARATARKSVFTYRLPLAFFLR